MRSFSLKYIFPIYISIVLLDLNEFVTRYLGSDGALTIFILGLSTFLLVTAKPLDGGGGGLNRAFLFAFLGFLILGVFAGALEGNLYNILKDVRYYLPSLLIYFAVFRMSLSIRAESELFRTIAVATFFIGINAVFIILSITLNIDFHGSTGAGQIERAVGLYSNANRAGYVSTIGQSFALLLLFSGNAHFKNFYFGLYLLCLFAAVSTFSKGAILLSMLLMGRMIYLGLNTSVDPRRKALKKYVQRFTILIMILLIASIFGALNIQSQLTGLQNERLNQVQMLIQGQINEETTTHRSELAAFALQEMEDTFFLGAGLGKFKKMAIGNGTHNIYLLILGEAGVIALVLYIVFLARWAKKSFASADFSAIKFASGNIMILFFFSGFAAHTLLANKPYILSLAIIIASLRIRELTNRTYL